MNIMKKNKETDLAAIGSGGLTDTGLLTGKVQKSGSAMSGNSNGIGTGSKNVMNQNSGNNVMTQGVQNTYRQRKPVAYDAESGGYALRQSLNNAGISDDDIKYDGTYVSVGSKKYLPNKNLNGVTFAPRSDINNFINAIYKEKGMPLTQANEYINEYGLTGLLSWNDDTKQVLIDGKPVDYAYVDDNGNAWVQKSILDAAYKEAAERRGMLEDKTIDDNYRKRRDELEEAAQNLIDKEKNWNFTADDIKNDPEYQARSKQFRAEAMRSYLDTMNDMAARNGGNLSSAAIQAAGAVYNRNMEGLHGIAAEVRNNAYNRFMSGLNAERDELAVLRDNALTEYQMRHQANDRELEQSANLEADEMNRRLNKQTLEGNALTLEQARLENDYKNALARGYWLPDEAARWGVSVDSSPFDAGIAQKRQNWIGADKEIYQDQLDMQTEKFKEETRFNDKITDENADDAARRSEEAALAQIWGNHNADKAMLDYKIEKGLIKPEDNAYVKSVVNKAIDMGYAAPGATTYAEALAGAYEYIMTHEKDNIIGVTEKGLTEEEKKKIKEEAAALLLLVSEE